jgi:plasmid stabilization system protein ParE
MLAERDRQPEAIQREIRRLRTFLRAQPEMYPMVEEGEFKGRRRFLVAGHGRVHIYYRVRGESRDPYVIALRPARGRPI